VSLEGLSDRHIEGKGGNDATLIKTNASLVSQAQELQRKISEHEGQLEVLEASGARHAEINTKLSEQCEGLKGKHDKIKAKRNAARTAKDDLAQQLTDCVAARDHIVRQLAECTTAKTTLADQLAECSAEKGKVAG